MNYEKQLEDQNEELRDKLSNTERIAEETFMSNIKAHRFIKSITECSWKVSSKTSSYCTHFFKFADIHEMNSDYEGVPMFIVEFPFYTELNPEFLSIDEAKKYVEGELASIVEEIYNNEGI